MQYLISHRSRARHALAIAVATTMFLLGLAASAAAEGPPPGVATDEESLTAATSESSASTEATTPTSPPAEPAGATPGDSPPASEPPPVSSSSATGELPEATSGSVASLRPETDAPAPGVHQVSELAGDQVSELAGAVHRDASEVTAPVTDAVAATHATVTRSGERAARIAEQAGAVDQVGALAHQPFEAAAGVLRHASLALQALDKVEAPPGESPSQLDLDALLPQTTSMRPDVQRSGSYLHDRSAPLRSLLTLYLGEPGGVGPSGLEVLSAAHDRAAGGELFPAPPEAPEPLEGAGSHSQDPISNDGNSPSPLYDALAKTATAPGLGGSSSVPIAALLALLALATPAIFRRLGEGAGFRPPTPFVCALERPG
jgi:hypothetical protein